MVKINDILVTIMKSYSLKGHIDELIEITDDEQVLDWLNRLKVIVLADEISQSYDMAEVDQILLQLDKVFFGEELMPESDTDAYMARHNSIIRELYENDDSDASLALYHLSALHLKIQIHEPTEYGTCSTCTNRIHKYHKVCPNCGTRFRKGNNMKKPSIPFKKFAIALIVIIALLILTTCVQIIPEGSTGIRITMGKVDKNLIQPGPVLKLPLVQDIKTVNNKQQTYRFSDRIWGESSEQTVVYMEGVAASYQIMPEYSVWLYINVTDYQANALPSTVVSSAMKAAMVELSTDTVTNRAKIEPIAVEKLQSALNDKYEGNEVVHITSINIDNMDFEDNYNQAIEQRQIAKLEYEKQQTEIKTQLEKAEADQKEREIKANAAAKEKEIQAQAEADAIKTVADAQAEANKKLAESLTKDLVDYQKIEKWNGELPQVQGGNAIIDMRDSKAETLTE